jgi:gamma-glutamyltranspeptidase/glutathione hydrolase
MMASVTLTHGDSFGAQVTVDGMGLLLGHSMSRFDPVPGRPNSIAPGKRPLDNMSPTIVLRDGKPMLAIGAAGGRRIPNGIFGVLSNFIIGGRSLEESVTEPRLHTEGGLSIYAERGRPETENQYLKRIGYTIAGPQQCYVAAVQIDPAKKNGRAVGVSDVPPENGPGVRNPHPVVTIAGSPTS